MDTISSTTKPALRATFETIKLAGRSRGHVCKLSDTGWQVTGQGFHSKEGLIESLRGVLKRQCDYLHTRRYVRKGNVTFALYYANGWQYDIVRDDGSFSVSMLTTQDYHEALDQMLAHASQHDGV